MKLCKDCRWFFKAELRCGHPSAYKEDMVLGRDSYYRASTQRESRLPEDCGRDAQHFEGRTDG